MVCFKVFKIFCHYHGGNLRDTQTLKHGLSPLYFHLNLHLFICIEDNWGNKSRVCTNSNTNINIVMSEKQNSTSEIIEHKLLIKPCVEIIKKNLAIIQGFH